MTHVQQVQAWYAENEERLSRLFSTVQAAFDDPYDPGGEASISLESTNLIANISIYNTGQISVPAVGKATGQEFCLDARTIAPDEDLAITLDHYIERINSPT